MSPLNASALRTSASGRWTRGSATSSPSSPASGTYGVLPNLEEALWAGQHSRNSHGLLDGMIGAVASRELVVLAEVSPSQDWEALVKLRPAVASTFTALRVRALDQEEGITRGGRGRPGAPREPPVAVEHDVLRDAFELAVQFQPGVAAPGNLLRVTRKAADAATEAGSAGFGQIRTAGDTREPAAACRSGCSTPRCRWIWPMYATS